MDLSSTMERIDNFGIPDFAPVSTDSLAPADKEFVQTPELPPEVPEFDTSMFAKKAIGIVRAKIGGKEMRLLHLVPPEEIGKNSEPLFILRNITIHPHYKVTDSALERPRGGKKPFTLKEAKDYFLALAEAAFPSSPLKSGTSVPTFEIIL